MEPQRKQHLKRRFISSCKENFGHRKLRVNLFEENEEDFWCEATKDHGGIESTKTWSTSLLSPHVLKWLMSPDPKVKRDWGYE
jgi:hypothetical protein